MKKFFCYGKKGFCEEQEEPGMCPQNCPYIFMEVVERMDDNG